MTESPRILYSVDYRYYPPGKDQHIVQVKGWFVDGNGKRHQVVRDLKPHCLEDYVDRAKTEIDRELLGKPESWRRNA